MTFKEQNLLGLMSITIRTGFYEKTGLLLLLIHNERVANEDDPVNASAVLVVTLSLSTVH